MFDGIVNVGNEVLFNIVQLVAGCILSIPLGLWVNARKGKTPLRTNTLIVFAVVGSLAGIILPLNTFGVLPLAAVLVLGGQEFCPALSLVVSNSLFNMLVPFTEIGFRWNQGFGRAVIALIIGAAAGMLLWKFKNSVDGIIRTKALANLSGGKGSRPEWLRVIGNSIYYAGGYILIGALIGTLIYTRLMEGFKAWFYGMPLGFEFGKQITRLNLFNIFFLTAMSIVDMLMNPLKLAALFTIFKPKGVAVWYIYFGAWSILLAISLFIKF